VITSHENLTIKATTLETSKKIKFVISILENPTTDMKINKDFDSES